MAFPAVGVTPPPLQPYQFSYNGYVFGPNTALELTKIEGIDMPAVRTGDSGRARDRGRFIGLDLMDGRDITITGELAAVPLVHNYVPDPSFEYDSLGTAPAAWLNAPGSGWTFMTAGATLTTVNTVAEFGVHSMEVVTTASANEGAVVPLGPLPAGTYTASVYLRGNAGGEAVSLLAGNHLSPRVSNVTLTNGWQQYSVTFTAVDDITNQYLAVQTQSATAVTFFVDGAMVTDSGLTYFDGDSPGYEWLGTHGDSTSQNAGGGTLAEAWTGLATATLPSGVVESPLYFATPFWGTLVTMARVRKRQMPLDIQAALGGLVNVALLFGASDPCWYSTPTLGPSTTAPGTGGFAFPLAFPLGFGGGTVAGAVSIDNAGDTDVRPILVVTGPCTNPSITNASAPGSPSVTFNVTMNAGDQLVIDTDMHTATYFTAGSTIGGNRVQTLAPGSQWWSLAPGVNSIQFLTSDPTSTGTLAVQYASAYIL